MAYIPIYSSVMKPISVAVICAALLYASCQKNVVPEVFLAGKWLWEKSAGGTTGNDLKTPLPGTLKILWILNESEYIVD
ncbi:MAG: hypothetical protein J0L54_08420 [Chitinophagales bacterium]|nr:hypothetical protein [Chitinophagales bacterium]